jgi:catechol 2,3-dioxygenase
MSSAGTHSSAGRTIAPETRMGAVHLTVSLLERSLDYWQRQIGLRVHEREGRVASLGTGGEDLVVLYEEPGARPVRGHTGLFHLALLLPERTDLARWLVHAAEDRVPLSGMSDHFVSEALYLSDPDGHGIEIYADRPRSAWERGGDGQLAMGTVALDVDALVGTIAEAPPEDFAGMPDGTTMGHVHLHVRDVGEADRFYGDTLGFDVMTHYGNQATFLSAGGYHHHLGANVWAGRGATPPPPGSASLRHATIVLPDRAEVDRVAGWAAYGGSEPSPQSDGVLIRDPSQNALLLVPSG